MMLIYDYWKKQLRFIKKKKKKKKKQKKKKMIEC